MAPLWLYFDNETTRTRRRRSHDHDHARKDLLTMNLFTDSFEAIALHDEFQWLQQCLDASERGRKQLIGTVHELQRRIAQLEGAAESTAAQTERQWTARLEQKEREWMQEYDAQAQSLLRIIRHHERTHARMDKELRDAQSAARERVSSSTQTELVPDCRSAGDPQYLSACNVAPDASACRACRLESASLSAEVDDHAKYAEPSEIVQVGSCARCLLCIDRSLSLSWFTACSLTKLVWFGG